MTMFTTISVVISTQYMENYGAHDWDGEGQCPQYWKPKGGNTYFVSASADDIASADWWETVESGLTHGDEYSREYPLDTKVVDLVDFVESDFIEFWESAIYVHVADDGVLHMEKKQLNFTNEVVAIQRWTQKNGQSLNGELTELPVPYMEPWRFEKECESYDIDGQFEELEAMMTEA